MIYQERHRLDVEKILYILAKCNAVQSNTKDFICDNITILQALGFSDSINRILSDNKLYNSLREATFSLYVNTMLGKMETASEYFSASEYKVREYLDKEQKEQRFNDRITPNDISYISYYIAIKHGIDRTILFLDSWTPYAAAEYYTLTYNLLLTGKETLARKLMANANDIDMFASILSAFRKSNSILAMDAYDKLVDLIEVTAWDKKIREEDYKYRIELMEDLLKLNKKELVRKISDTTDLTLDGTYISFYHMNGELPKEYYFKLYAIRLLLNNKNYDFKDFLESNHLVIKENNKENTNCNNKLN